MKYSLLTYAENKKTFNVGDNIQSLAAKQYLPKVDTFLNREELADYNGEPTKLIMNGWFTHNVHNWVPSNQIIPLFVSFHINNTAIKSMLTEKAINYLKQHQPIGCRDQFSADTLNSYGIEAYFTGCLTLTLDTYKVDDKERGDEVYIVDPLYSYPNSTSIFYNYKSIIKNVLNGKIFQLNKRQKHIERFIDAELLKKAKYITQVLPAKTYTDIQKFEIAEENLRKYAKAKLVITSRIHCALPCLAMGTPVIFVNGFDSFVDTCRFDGILDLFNRIDINTNGEFTSNFGLNGKIKGDTVIRNLDRHAELSKALKEGVINLFRIKFGELLN